MPRTWPAFKHGQLKLGVMLQAAAKELDQQCMSYHGEVDVACQNIQISIDIRIYSTRTSSSVQLTPARWQIVSIETFIPILYRGVLQSHLQICYPKISGLLYYLAVLSR